MHVCAYISSQRVFVETFLSDYHYFAKGYKQLCSYSFVMIYLYLILIYKMYISYIYCYISYKCCTAIQKTRIPSEMCVGETCTTDGRHASLVICVWGNTHPQGCMRGKYYIRGNTHTYDTGLFATNKKAAVLVDYRYKNV